MRGGTAQLMPVGILLVLLAGCQAGPGKVEAPRRAPSMRTSLALPGPDLAPADPRAWYTARNDGLLGDPAGRFRPPGEAIVVTRDRVWISNGRPSGHSQFDTFTVQRPGY